MTLCQQTIIKLFCLSSSLFLPHNLRAQETVPRSAAQTAAASQDIDISKLPQQLFPACRSIHPTPVPEAPDDQIQDIFAKHQHLRLVIGAGEYQDDPNDNNRPFVAPTASLIDRRLDQAGYHALPELTQNNSNIPYLEGKRATKTAIKSAVVEMANLLQQDDFGVIYYIGHGFTAPSHKDVTLSVYDRPVTDDDGIRVSDIIGILETTLYRSDIREIPHIIIIVEACYSGSATPPDESTVVNDGDLQLVERVDVDKPPPQIVVISATSAGTTTQAYNLHGTNLSAFGYFFLRALNEDWGCVDANRDGIITLNELINYLKERLDTAATVDPPAIDGQMIPRASSSEPLNFIAYSAKYHEDDGDRVRIHKLFVRPNNNHISTLTLPSGNTYNCTHSSPCEIPISTNLSGDIKVNSQPISDPSAKEDPLKVAGSAIAGAVSNVFGGNKTEVCNGCDSPSLHAREGRVSVDDLTANPGTSRTVAGVPIKVQ